MNTFKYKLLHNWHLVRIMRLGIGMMLLVTGIQQKDWPIGLFSIFFLYQAITDTGYCAANGCNAPARSSKQGAIAETTVEYEEVK